MSNGIQGTSNQPVNLDTSSIDETGTANKAVGSGLINSDAKLQMMQSKKAITGSQLAHRPTLLKPKDIGMKAQASANQAASNDLSGLGKMTEAASSKVAAAMMRAQVGMQTPEDQNLFRRNAKILDDGADYIDSLFKGNNQLSKNEKTNILGGQGFNDQQIEDLLLSQSDQAGVKSKIQKKHGDTYHQNLADLKKMGYDEDQAKLLLILGDDNIIKNDKRKLEISGHFKGNNNAQNLAKMGFNQNQINDLLNGKQAAQGQTKSRTANEHLSSLNQKMGFSEKEAKILLASAQSEKANEQSNLIKRLQKNHTQVSNNMRRLSKNAQLMSNSPSKPFLEEHLKQQADIFMVLELIHEMSVKQRRFGREMRQLEHDSAMKETLKQADHIRKAAVMQLAADCVSGGMSIAGGFMSMSAGLKGASKSKKTAAGKKDDISIDDVQISKSGTKRSKESSIDGTDSAQGKHRENLKKEQSKQREGDEDINQAKHYEDKKQKQQKGTEQEAVKTQEQKSDAQTGIQQTEAEIKPHNKTNIPSENKPADNQAKVQSGKDAELKDHKFTVELRNSNAQPSRTKRSGGQGRRSNMTRWSDEDIAKLKTGQGVRTNKTGAGASEHVIDKLNEARSNKANIKSDANKNIDADNQSTGTLKKSTRDIDLATIKGEVSNISKIAKARRQGLNDAKKNAQKAQKQADENSLEAQELSAQKNAQKKKNITIDQEKDAQAIKTHKSDSQADAQGAENNLNNQNKKEEIISQNEDSSEIKSANKSGSKDIENSQDKDTKAQQKLNALQGNAAIINSLFTGLGSVASAGFRFLATEEQALQKESEARQKMHENAAQSWSEWMQLHQDQVKNCQSKIEEINRIHFDTLKSLSRG